MKTDTSLRLKCSSPLDRYVEDYIAQKKALGLKCRTDTAILNIFDAFCANYGILKPELPQELYDAWCVKRPHESGTTQRSRICYIRMFAQFLHNNGVPAPTVFLPLPQKGKTFVPHIFTHDEIARLLSAADRMKPPACCRKQYVTHIVMPVLLRLLYCCGLRLGEALKLKNVDVDTNGGVLRLLETKGNKERIVPMSSSLTKICGEYRANSQVTDYKSEYFFPAPDNLHYASNTIYTHFRNCLFAAGISHGGRGKGPRLHDLRHTFTVHTLNKWVSEGRDIYVIIPILSNYLGHENMTATEKYLRLVPEAHTLLTRPFEEKFGGVFPEVTPL